MLLPLLILVVCLIGLWKGADIIVLSASRIAKKLGMSDLVIGLTVIAFATSAPEFAVTVSAALADKSDISVGNVVGSNIFNLFFILGLVAVVGTVKSTKKMVYRDGTVLIGTSILLFIFLYDLTLSQFEGAIFLFLLVAYLAYLFVHKDPEAEFHDDGDFKWYHSFQFIAGTAIIVVSGHYFVDSASEIARILGVSEWAIGVTIVAAGTSAPEMATSLVAVIKGRHGMSAGNLIGSDIFNLLGVLGVASLIKPLTIIPSAFGSITLLTGALFVVVFFMRTGWKVSRVEGVILLLIVVVRWYFDFSG
ncbi:MAG: sodium:calcium antiporter [Melioribacteraceae bacterium]|nr:MAG: sodium:calcium antiporter [Melioribacteraceae bacterium]